MLGRTVVPAAQFSSSFDTDSDNGNVSAVVVLSLHLECQDAAIATASLRQTCYDYLNPVQSSEMEVCVAPVNQQW